MQTIRCIACNKKLAEAEFTRISIKCPRCRVINQLKAPEPLLPETQDETHRTVDRRQAQAG